MSAALVTAGLLAVAGLLTSFVLGYTADSAAGLWQHTSLAIFATLMALLSHSMTMFYLIGKGKAIREAVTHGGLPSEPVARFSQLRRPVFSTGLLAIVLTMATAIVGAGVDTGSVPGAVHLGLAIVSLAANVAALRAEIIALTGGVRIASEVDRLLSA